MGVRGRYPPRYHPRLVFPRRADPRGAGPTLPRWIPRRAGYRAASDIMPFGTARGPWPCGRTPHGARDTSRKRPDRCAPLQPSLHRSAALRGRYRPSARVVQYASNSSLLRHSDEGRALPGFSPKAVARPPMKDDDCYWHAPPLGVPRWALPRVARVRALRASRRLSSLHGRHLRARRMLADGVSGHSPYGLPALAQWITGTSPARPDQAVNAAAALLE